MSELKVDVIVGLQSGDEGKVRLPITFSNQESIHTAFVITAVVMQATPSTIMVRSL
jgi:hypothetical protein